MHLMLCYFRISQLFW